MTDILVVGDVHAADQSPAARTETYREDILVKLREIVEVGKDTDCILFMGDIFHQKQPRKISHKLVLEITEILSGHPNVLIVVGNHDITEGRLESLEKQPLAVLGRMSNITLLEWNSFELNDVCIYPIPGVPNITVDDYRLGKRLTDAKWNIIASHQSVVPNIKDEMPVLQDKPFIHDSQAVADITEAQIVLYGHQHRNDGVYKRNDKIFSNLGSICRGTIGNEDLNKVPSVLLLRLNEKVEGKVIPLKNVRPKEEVFRLEEHFEAKAHRKDIEDAISQLKDTKLAKFSLESVIGDISLREDIDDSIKHVAINLLEAVS